MYIMFHFAHVIRYKQTALLNKDKMFSKGPYKNACFFYNYFLIVLLIVLYKQSANQMKSIY